MGGTHEHLEHAEHAEHAAHDPFDRRVAMTMAIVAACLASVTLLSHREHNNTILQQAQATRLHTQASDDWNFYQAKNIRMHLYTAMADLDGSLADTAVVPEKAKKVKDDWSGKSQRYDEEDLPDLEKQARLRVMEAVQHEGLSHVAHERSDYFDGGELCLELALVLCSISLLTKLKAFWFSGIAISMGGLAIALIPFTPLFGAFTKHDDHAKHEVHAPAKVGTQTFQGKLEKVNPERGTGVIRDENDLPQRFKLGPETKVLDAEGKEIPDKVKAFKVGDELLITVEGSGKKLVTKEVKQAKPSAATEKAH